MTPDEVALAIEAGAARDTRLAWMTAAFAGAAFAGKLPSLDSLLSKPQITESELMKKRLDHDVLLRMSQNEG